ncbi:GH25 family lysozyme [Fulvivirga sp.]|uniref:glycoside hydrolase family 25 protein n=1 Tax=Fulvivirga sp. TaxID=1931237 RepID=UPI0032EB9034
MKKKIWTILITGAAIMFGLAFLLFKGYVRFNYPSKKEYPIQGIDISHHQGLIDWDELTKEDIKFVFVKATEGGDYKDPRFLENWENTKNNNIPVGAYHFYRICKDGIEQAENFISSVPNDRSSLPPVIDLEYGGNCQTNKSKEVILSEIREFMTILENHYQKTPIIYVTKEFYKDYSVSQFSENPIWIRDIFTEPNTDNINWTLWQFANRAHLKGIDMYVDLNVFNGSPDEFETFKKGL